MNICEIEKGAGCQIFHVNLSHDLQSELKRFVGSSPKASITNGILLQSS